MGIKRAGSAADSLNVSLPRAMKVFIEQLVDTGMYQSASEVVRESVRLFQRRHRAQEAEIGTLQRDVRQAIESLERGEGVDGREAFAELASELARLDNE